MVVIVVAAAEAVWVTVSHFFFRCIAYFADCDVEVQSHTSKSVVLIDSDNIVFNFHDGNHNTLAIAGIDSKLHTHGKIIDLIELFFRHILAQSIIPFAVTIFWFDRNLERIAFGLANQSSLKTRDNHASTVKVRQRIATIGCIKHLT